MTWTNKILRYHFALKSDIPLPGDVQWLYPYQDEDTRQCMRLFYEKYYNDDDPRRLILGINPGRFGAGLTGVPFTDPIRLASECGIESAFAKRQELSSVFIYEVIHAFGGCASFYNSVYISSICPLGFIKNNKNYNYYDDAELVRLVEPLIVAHIHAQIAMGCDTDIALCLGQGKNFKYLESLNTRHEFFEKIIPLPHPRWVMQYRLKRKEEFVTEYLEALSA